MPTEVVKIVNSGQPVYAVMLAIVEVLEVSRNSDEFPSSWYQSWAKSFKQIRQLK